MLPCNGKRFVAAAAVHYHDMSTSSPVDLQTRKPIG